MTRRGLEDEKADLERKLRARERAGGGYDRNINAIKARIAWIDEELAKTDG